MSNNAYDVIIIGAGFAGVTAARDISLRDHKTLVLEGRDRKGGRTWVDHRLGVNLEMGGTFIHWFQPNIWAETMRYDLPVAELNEIERAYWKSGDKIHTGTKDDEFDRMRIGMKVFAQDTLKYFPRPYEPLTEMEKLKEIDHISIRDHLDAIKPQVGQEIYDVLDGYWSAYFCTDDLTIPALSQAYRWLAMSHNNWDIMEDIFELYKFENGTKSLIDAIWEDARADIKFEAAVTAVERTGDGYKVSTRDGQEYTAKAVISTLPINTLNNVKFTPPLPKELQDLADERQTSDTGAKIWVKVGNIDHTFRFTAPSHPSSSLHVQFFDREKREGILMGYVSNGTKLDVDNKEEVQEFLRMWMPEIEVIETTGHNWYQDEFALGTWPVARTEQLTKYGDAIRDAKDGFFLAGSDYADGWSGFMDGAIESGKQNAFRAHQYLKSL